MKRWIGILACFVALLNVRAADPSGKDSSSHADQKSKILVLLKQSPFFANSALESHYTAAFSEGSGPVSYESVEYFADYLHGRELKTSNVLASKGSKEVTTVNRQFLEDGIMQSLTLSPWEKGRITMDSMGKPTLQGDLFKSGMRRSFPGNLLDPLWYLRFDPTNAHLLTDSLKDSINDWEVVKMLDHDGRPECEISSPTFKYKIDVLSGLLLSAERFPRNDPDAVYQKITVSGNIVNGAWKLDHMLMLSRPNAQSAWNTWDIRFSDVKFVAPEQVSASFSFDFPAGTQVQDMVVGRNYTVTGF
jgi:hypothetical protein